MTQVKIDIPLPEGIAKADREAIADEIIEHIRERTEGGVDKYGKKFQGYSDEYIKSLDFRAASKSAKKVNLTLSGDMLISLMLLKEQREKLTIGFRERDIENDKALGNIKGTYGADHPITKPRDFMGIDTRALAKIVRKYVDDMSLYEIERWMRSNYDAKQSEKIPA